MNQTHRMKEILRRFAGITGLATIVARHDGIDLVPASEGGAILMYHTVGERYPDGSILPVQTFRNHLEFLTTEYTLVDFRDILHPESDPSGTVALTFDGGYRDFYHTILPILHEFDVPAEVFVVPRRLGNENGQPADATKWVDWFDFLTNDQLEEIIEDSLVTVGNKTLTHDRPLLDLTDEELERQVVKGKSVLESRFAVSIDSFCYPRGEFNERCVEVVSRDHDYAVTTRSAFANATTDPVRIPRFTADWTTVSQLRERLSDAYVVEQNARRIF